MIEQLLKESQGGSMNSFARLFTEYTPQLESFVYRLTADRDETQDILQDVFIKSFEALDSFKGTGQNIKLKFEKKCFKL